MAAGRGAVFEQLLHDADGAVYEQLLHNSEGRGRLQNAELVRGICRLNSCSKRATGWWMGNFQGAECIVTNHHVFPSAEDADGAVATFDFSNAGAKISVPLKPSTFFWSNKSLDAAIVAFDARPVKNSNICPLPVVDTNSEHPDDGSSVIIWGHPRGRPLEMSMGKNTKKKGFKITYNMDTEPGSSGSPVLCDTMKVHFLHSSGSPEGNIGICLKEIFMVAKKEILDLKLGKLEKDVNVEILNLKAQIEKLDFELAKADKDKWTDPKWNQVRRALHNLRSYEVRGRSEDYMIQLLEDPKYSDSDKMIDYMKYFHDPCDPEMD